MVNKSRLLIFAVFSCIPFYCSSQSPPDERCSEAGDLVCIDCFTVGECRVNSSSPTGFNVLETVSCVSGAFCDLSIEEGGCIALNPTLTDCGCSDDSCHIDPNDPSKYLNCAKTPSQSSGPCNGDVNLSTCSCYNDIISTTVSTSTTTDHTKTTSLPSGNSPEERCNAEEDVVCIDCFTVGTCVPDPRGGFSVLETESCRSDAFCDRTIADGECVPLNPAITDCGCLNATCLIDPNDSSRFISCSDMPGQSQQCNGTVSLPTCTCEPSTTSPSTYTFTTSTPTSSYTTINYASTTNSSALTSTSSLTSSYKSSSSSTSYDNTTISSVLTDTTTHTSSYKTSTTSTTSSTSTTSTTSTTSSTSTTSTTFASTAATTEPSDCPTCGLIPDNNPNTCTGYIICRNGDHANCPGSSCFDPDSCRCVPT